MDKIWQLIMDELNEWLRNMLTDAILSNLRSLFDGIDTQVSWAAGELGKTPQGFNPEVFRMIQRLSENVILPIAGLVIAFFCTWELIQMIIDRNNMHDFGLADLFKWIFKTSLTIIIVTNTWNIVMAIFDVSQHVTNEAAKVIRVSNMNTAGYLENFEQMLSELGIGELFSMLMVSSLCHVAVWVIYVIIFIIVISRMIEIYLTTSVAPIPIATLLRKDASHGMGLNYIKNLCALGFQAFLIIVCIGIYSVLVRTMPLNTDGSVMLQLITLIGYTVLLCFAMFKTGSIAKSVFNAH